VKDEHRGPSRRFERLHRQRFEAEPDAGIPAGKGRPLDLDSLFQAFPIYASIQAKLEENWEVHEFQLGPSTASARASERERVCAIGIGFGRAGSSAGIRTHSIWSYARISYQ
jgi:hypothetical protein